MCAFVVSGKSLDTMAAEVKPTITKEAEKKCSSLSSLTADVPKASPLEEQFARLLYGTKWFRLILAGLSGIMLILAFPPFDQSALIWFALLPLLLSIFSAPTIVQAGLSGLITGIVFYSFSLSFFIGRFGVIGLFIGNLLSVYLALFAVSVWFVTLRWGLKAGVLLTPIIWSGIEYFRSECYILKFSWLALGYSQHNNLTIIQVCDLIGVYGLSFIIVIINALISWFILEIIRRKRVKWWSLITAGVILGTVLISGIIKISRVMNKPLASSPNALKAVVIQENIGSLDRYIELTRQVVSDGEGRTIVAWPEAGESDVLYNSEDLKKVVWLVKEKKIYLVVGTIEPTGKPIRFNNFAVLFAPNGEILGAYAKRTTVQFVENIIEPGTEVGVYQTPLGKVGILICYEMGFTADTREVITNGASLLVIPTLEINPSLLGKLEHIHHASMAPFRAIETRRFIIRPAAFGISQIVHPSGLVQGQLNYLTTGSIQTIVTTKNLLTFYIRAGYLLPIILMYFYAVLMVVNIVLWLKTILPVRIRTQTGIQKKLSV